MKRIIQPAQAAVLWDIDGTLIRRAGPEHRQALITAIRRVTGLETNVDGIPLHGMLDPDILTAMMLKAGARAAEIRRAMPEIERHAENYYLRHAACLERKVCPGVRRLLRRLERAGVPMGLVSGNFPRIGWRKVEKAGLKRFFVVGAFAGMGKDRAALVSLALRMLRREGRIGRRALVSLVGDTPRDVMAARLAGVRAVAVATGLCSFEELAGAKPDILVEDLRRLPLEALLEA